MAGFLVTQNFTRNGVARQDIFYVNSVFAASAVAAVNLAVAAVQNQLNVKAAAQGDTVVFGASSVAATAQ